MSTRPPICSDGGVADVAAFEVRHPRIGPQPLVQLPVPDVERDHVGRAALEETVGEAARRGTGVEGAQAAHVDREHRQRVVELLGAPSHEPSRRTVDEDGVGRRHLAGRLVGHRSVDEHAVLADQGLGFGAAADQLATDQFGVEPTPWCHSTSGSGGAGCLLRRALLGGALLGGALLGRCLLGSALLGRCLLGGGLLRGCLLRRSLLGRGLLGRAFFAAAAFFAGAFLADVFLTTTNAEAEGTRSASISVSASNRSSSSSKRSDMLADLLRHLALHVGCDALGRFATAIDQLLYDPLCVASLDLAPVDQLFDEGIRPASRVTSVNSTPASISCWMVGISIAAC